MPHLITRRGNMRADVFHSDQTAVCRGRVEDLLAPVEMPWPVSNWSAYLRQDEDDKTARTLRERMRTGRPCGSPGFVERLEPLVGRSLRPARRGPKPKTRAEEV